MENTFAKKVQKAMGSAIPDWIPRGKWRGGGQLWSHFDRYEKQFH